MNDLKLISIKELALRWGKDEGTVRRYIKEGILTPCAGVPGIMFHPEIIEKLEGVNINPMSPIERRNLLRKIKCLEKQNEELKNVLGNILSESSKVISLINQGGQAI